MPHSESVKVLGPKWRKSAIEESCHSSWGDEGRGKMGRGGGFLRGELEMGMKYSASRVRMRFCEMGFVQLFLFFFIVCRCGPSG